MELLWPEMFETNTVSADRDACLADQLVAWGNILLGAPPPDNFYEMMESASKVTGAFTSTECNDVADRVIFERKRKSYEDASFLSQEKQ